MHPEIEDAGSDHRAGGGGEQILHRIEYCAADIGNPERRVAQLFEFGCRLSGFRRGSVAKLAAPNAHTGKSHTVHVARLQGRFRTRLESQVMRFGFFIPQGWRLDLVGIDPAEHWAVMRDLATYADGSAWDSVWVYDHFRTVPMPTSEATHEAWSLMSAYAATTSRVKLGQMCTGCRNPAYLAKVAATADIISGGRIQMGIGGGWYEHEWRAYGYGFPSRACGWADSMRASRSCVMPGATAKSASPVSTIRPTVLSSSPKPLQDNGIPLWIAGGGEQKTLRIAAKYAQYTNFTGEPEGFTPSPKSLPAIVATSAPTSMPSSARSTSTRSSARVKLTSTTVSQRIRDRLAGYVPESAADAMLAGTSGPDSAVGTPRAGGRAATARVARPRLRIRDLLFPRSRVRPVRGWNSLSEK